MEMEKFQIITLERRARIRGGTEEKTGEYRGAWSDLKYRMSISPILRKEIIFDPAMFSFFFRIEPPSSCNFALILTERGHPIICSSMHLREEIGY